MIQFLRWVAQGFACTLGGLLCLGVVAILVILAICLAERSVTLRQE